jgi:hypothetical protein
MSASKHSSLTAWSKHPTDDKCLNNSCQANVKTYSSQLWLLLPLRSLNALLLIRGWYSLMPVSGTRGLHHHVGSEPHIRCWIRSVPYTAWVPVVQVRKCLQGLLISYICVLATVCSCWELWDLRVSQCWQWCCWRCWASGSWHVEGLQCLCGQGHTVQHVCSVGVVVGGKSVAGGSRRGF